MCIMHLDCSVIYNLKRTKSPNIKRLNKVQKLKRYENGNNLVFVANIPKRSRSVALMRI